MNDRQYFITFYLDDYVRMAYRELTNSIKPEDEDKLISNLYYLLDRYADGELSNYIHYNKIV